MESLTCQGPSGPYDLLLQLTATGPLPSTVKAIVLDRRRRVLNGRSRIVLGFKETPVDSRKRPTGQKLTLMVKMRRGARGARGRHVLI